MSGAPSLAFSGVVPDPPDAQDLAGFYRRLLGWAVDQDEPGWMKLPSPQGGPGLSFQSGENYRRPTWPAGSDDQQMSIHLDFAVDDLAVAGAHAVGAGATLRSSNRRTTCACTSTRPATRSACSCPRKTSGRRGRVGADDRYRTHSAEPDRRRRVEPGRPPGRAGPMP